MEQARTTGAQRPTIVDLFALAMVVSVFWSMYLTQQRSTFCTFVWLAIEAPLIYWFWSGRNWMRFLTMIVSVIALLGVFVFALPHEILVQLPRGLVVKLVFDAALGLALLIGLNTAPVRAYFHARSIERKTRS